MDQSQAEDFQAIPQGNVTLSESSGLTTISIPENLLATAVLQAVTPCKLIFRVAMDIFIRSLVHLATVVVCIGHVAKSHL